MRFPACGLMVQGEISNYKGAFVRASLHDAQGRKRGHQCGHVPFRCDAAEIPSAERHEGHRQGARQLVPAHRRGAALRLRDHSGRCRCAQPAFEQLKAKLQAEGLFSERYKKPIPSCPDSIALVTSPTGAAVRDMIRILGGRWPLAKAVCSIRRRCRVRARRRVLHARSLWRMPSAKQMSFCAAEAAARWRICGRSMRK